MAVSGRILLASTSPRRRALLDDAGIEYRCVTPGHEPEEASAPPKHLVLERAEAKAKGAVPLLDSVHSRHDVVVGVDTVVESAGASVGKPRDAGHAASILGALAATGTHRVHSAHCAVSTDGKVVRSETTTSTVRLDPDVEGWLPAWLESGLWRGKAGAYGIQDPEAGFVTLVAGELGTVVGMSVPAVRSLVAQVRAALGGDT